MVTTLPRSLVERARRRVRERPQDSETRETGSLILDILIGMAIFALIAIIAISAIGQYRMRTYIQAAVSDAQQTAYAVSASITDQATETSEDHPAGFPTGVLTAADLEALEVTPTSGGAKASVISVTQGLTNAEDFSVCVEYRGAFAVYDTGEGGLIDSGDMEKEDFKGCGEQPVVVPPDCEVVPATDAVFETRPVSTPLIAEDRTPRRKRVWLPWEIAGLDVNGGGNDGPFVKITEEVWRNDLYQNWWPTAGQDLDLFTVNQSSHRVNGRGEVYYDGQPVLDDNGEPALGWDGINNQVLPWYEGATGFWEQDSEHDSHDEARPFTEDEWRAQGEGFDWWYTSEADKATWSLSTIGRVLHNGEPVTYEHLVTPAEPEKTVCPEVDPGGGGGTPVDPAVEPDCAADYGPEYSAVWYDEEPGGSYEETARGVQKREYVLPWEVGFTSEQDWRERGQTFSWNWAGQDWWHGGQPERFTVDRDGFVRRDGVYFTYTDVNEYYNNYETPNTPATGLPVDWHLPWEQGITKAQWNAQGHDWWHGGEPERFTINPDSGYVSRDGQPVLYTVTYEATPGYWQCEWTSDGQT